jgi:hypothetical protein
MYLWNCREISTTRSWRSHDNECRNNLLRVSEKAMDHHHLSSQIAMPSCSMTTHWIHQLLTVGVDKYIIICPKSGQTIPQNLHPEFVLHFQKQQQEDSVTMWELPRKRHN